jgi:hypothetical protein
VCRHTPEGHADHKSLCDALQLVSDITMHVNKGIHRSEAQQKVREVEATLISAPALSAPHREFLREGYLVKVGATGNRNTYVSSLVSDWIPNGSVV